jgi:hypothetical protein
MAAGSVDLDDTDARPEVTQYRAYADISSCLTTATESSTKKNHTSRWAEIFEL